MSDADVLVIAWECDAHLPLVPRCSGLSEALGAPRWPVGVRLVSAPKLVRSVCSLVAFAGCEEGVLLIFHLYSQLSLDLSHLQKNTLMK